MAYNQDTNTIVDNSGFAYTPTNVGLTNYNSGASQAISVDQLQTAKPVTVPQTPPTVDPLPEAAAGADAASKSLDQYIKDNTAPTTPLDNQYQGILNDIASITGKEANRGTDQLTAEQQANIPGQQQDLAKINAQITQAVAEANQSTASYEQLVANLENPQNQQQQGIPMSAIIGQQAQVRKQQMADATLRAANLNVLQAFALGKQGQLQAAQASVNRAIDLKYQTIDAELNTRQAQLQAIQPLLDKEERIQALALQQRYDDQKQALQEKKQKEATNLNLAVANGVKTQFVNNNGTFFNSATGEAYSNPADFFKAAGVTSFDQAYQKGLVSDVNAGTTQDRDLVAQAAAKYPDAGILLTDTPDQMQAKLQNSRIYRKDTYIAPNAYSGGGGGGLYVPGADPTVDAYITAIKNGNGTLANVPAAIRGQVTQGLAQGNQGSAVVDPQTDAKVKAIIANASGWGDAADKIKALLNDPNGATKYDAQLKAVYQNKQSVSDAFGNSTIYSPLAGSRFTMEANRITSNYIDLPSYKLAAGGIPYVSRILAASSNPGSVSDQELIDAFTKLNSSGNAITDAQVKVITGGKSWSDSINVFQNKTKNGGVLSDNQRKQIIDIAQKTLQAYQKDYQPIYNEVKGKLDAAGIPEAFQTIPDLNSIQSQGSQSNPQTYTVNGVTYHLGADGLYYAQ
jgi:hypothetical protein